MGKSPLAEIWEADLGLQGRTQRFPHFFSGYLSPAPPAIGRRAVIAANLLRQDRGNSAIWHHV